LKEAVFLQSDEEADRNPIAGEGHWGKDASEKNRVTGK